MTKELRECSDEYDLISNRGVHPICKEDAHIIDKLTKILVEMEAKSDLIKALREWKKSPDSDILGMLEKIEVDVEQDVDGVMKKTIDFVEIGSHVLAVRSLFSIRKVDSYDTKGNCPVYKILINESENVNVINGNKEVLFSDWDEREAYVEQLGSKLSEFTNVRFL